MQKGNHRQIIELLLSYENRETPLASEPQEICRQLIAKVDSWLAKHGGRSARTSREAEIAEALESLANDATVTKLIRLVVGLPEPATHQQVTNTGDGAFVAVAGGNLKVSGPVFAQAQRIAPAKATTHDDDTVNVVPWGDRSVDLLIHARTTAFQGEQVLEYILISPSEVVPFQGQKFRQPLKASSGQFQVDWRNRVEKLSAGKELDGEQLLQEDIPSSIESLGQTLYRRFFPADLRKAYRQFRKLVKTLVVVSDEPWIPWEWIKPFDDSDPDDVIDDKYLCMQFQLTRWLVAAPGPVAALRGARIARVGVEESQEGPRLSEAAGERDGLAALAKRTNNSELRRLTQARYRDVVELLSAGEHDVLHFAGHGDADPRHADDAWVELADRRLRARHLDGPMLRGIKKRRPLVFLNACRAAQQGWNVTGLGGWAEAWVRRAECGAFVGPQWTVRDRLAGVFAGAFYRALAAGDTIGLAAQKARVEVRAVQPGHPAWLAYAVYAHPGARLIPGTPSAVRGT